MKYNRDTFPFAGLFEDLTAAANSGGLTSIDAYLWYQRQRRVRKLHAAPDYGSTAITSSGHARRPNLDTRKIIEYNAETARELLVELARYNVISARRIINPGDLGYIPAWNQTDYMLFWLSVISGLNLELDGETGRAVVRFRHVLAQSIGQWGVDMDLMGDGLASPEERAPEYFEYARAFKRAIARLPGEHISVTRVICLIDTSASLGSQTERFFARQNDIPVYDLVGTDSLDDPTAAVHDPHLKQDIATIVKYGGTVVKVSPERHVLALTKAFRRLPNKRS